MAGPQTLTVPTRPGEDTGRTGRVLLEVISGECAGLRFALTRPGVTVGRAAAADICIPDDGISRAHAKIVVDEDGGATVVDLESHNGTFVNGAPVQRERLRDGDVIVLGRDTTLSFRHEYVSATEPVHITNPDESGPITSVFRRVAASLDTLGRMYEEKGDHERAAEAFRRSSEIREKRKAS